MAVEPNLRFCVKRCCIYVSPHASDKLLFGDSFGVQVFMVEGMSHVEQMQYKSAWNLIEVLLRLGLNIGIHSHLLFPGG